MEYYAAMKKNQEALWNDLQDIVKWKTHSPDYLLQDNITCFLRNLGQIYYIHISLHIIVSKDVEEINNSDDLRGRIKKPQQMGDRSDRKTLC